MSEFLFSRAAQIDIQGAYALNYVALTRQYAEFELIGFANPAIRLKDFRSSVRKIMADVLRTGKVEQLAQYFNQPALVKLYPVDSGKVTVTLEKTRAKKIRHMLWVAIGISNEIPYFHEYVRLQAEPFDKDTFALFYLFRKPKELDQQQEKFAEG
jgi:hypothetical protein